MLLKKIIIIIIVNYTIFICNFAAGKGRWSRLLEFFLGSRNAYFKWLFLNYIALRVRGLNVKFSLIPSICEQRREVGGVYQMSDNFTLNCRKIIAVSKFFAKFVT